jgi:hypothetical protein
MELPTCGPTGILGRVHEPPVAANARGVRPEGRDRLAKGADMEDAKAVWIELEKLWTSGRLRAAVLEDGPAGSLAARLVERVREHAGARDK